MAAETETYGKLVKIKIERQAGLFDGKDIVELHHYFHGAVGMSDTSVTVGGGFSGIISTGEKATNTINRSLSGGEIVAILEKLKSARQIIDDVDADNNPRSEARNAVDGAENDPSTGKLDRALG